MYAFLSGTSKADREERDAIESLYEHIAKLKSANSALSTKNKTLLEQLEKKKRELALSKRPTARRPPSAPTVKGEVDVVPGRTGKAEPQAPQEDESNWFEIAKKFKARLATAEEQLLKLREENEKLRTQRKVELGTAYQLAHNHLLRTPRLLNSRSFIFVWRFSAIRVRLSPWKISIRSGDCNSYKRSMTSL